MTYGYSLCDVMEIVECKNFLLSDQAEYIYIGSEFCDQYYVQTSTDLWEKCFKMVKEKRRQGILVVPVPSQKRLKKVKEKTDFILNTYGEWIQEIVVNDFAMLQWMTQISEKPLWCGRMLSKEPRDPRHIEQKQVSKLYERAENDMLFGVSVKGVEIDNVNLAKVHFANSCIAGIHVPYAYVSMSRICELGSIGYQIDQKFRLTNGCKRQCLSYYQEYTNKNIQFLKFGQAVYTNSQHLSEAILQNENIRIIYSAIFDWVRQSKEGSNEITCSGNIS